MTKKMCFRLLCVCLLSALLCSCSLPFGGMRVGISASEIRYANAGDYSVGNADLPADGIDGLEINWIAGEVTLIYDEGSTIRLSETSEQTISENFTLRYLADHGTLRVQYAKNGKHSFGSLQKHLTVRVPKSVLLAKVTVSTVSANLDAQNFGAGEWILKSVSGKMGISQAAVCASLSAETVSGNVSLTMLGTVGTLTFQSVSATLSMSGGITGKGIFETTSGNVFLALPHNASFAAKTDTVSGNFRCEFPTVQNGRTYTHGSGDVSLQFDTVSGDIEISGMDEPD